MPQGLDVTVSNIRPAFGLVKTKTQDIWPEQPFTPNMWVEYLWISFGTSWAQGGYCLGESGQNRPTEPSRSGPGGGYLWKGRRRHRGSLWKRCPQPPLRRCAPPPHAMGRRKPCPQPSLRRRAPSPHLMGRK